MIIVPGIAHDRQGGPRYIMRLNARAIDGPAPAAQQVQASRQRHSLKHPEAPEQTIETVPPVRAQIEPWRCSEVKTAVHLPPGIDKR